ncbi:hypothetical protein DFJ74DRAFT_668209 [Hyaloraphidium curvatum]|nr:hypothetical protein DFJ74DRAFT_668209 [Hyaloraphidium curvatum]
MLRDFDSRYVASEDHTALLLELTETWSELDTGAELDTGRPRRFYPNRLARGWIHQGRKDAEREICVKMAQAAAKGDRSQVDWYPVYAGIRTRRVGHLLVAYREAQLVDQKKALRRLAVEKKIAERDAAKAAKEAELRAADETKKEADAAAKAKAKAEVEAAVQAARCAVHAPLSRPSCGPKAAVDFAASVRREVEANAAAERRKKDADAAAAKRRGIGAKSPAEIRALDEAAAAAAAELLAAEAASTPAEQIPGLWPKRRPRFRPAGPWRSDPRGSRRAEADPEDDDPCFVVNVKLPVREAQGHDAINVVKLPARGSNVIADLQVEVAKRSRCGVAHVSISSDSAGDLKLLPAASLAQCGIGPGSTVYAWRPRKIVIDVEVFPMGDDRNSFTKAVHVCISSDAPIADLKRRVTVRTGANPAVFYLRKRDGSKPLNEGGTVGDQLKHGDVVVAMVRLRGGAPKRRRAEGDGDGDEEEEEARKKSAGEAAHGSGSGAAAGSGAPTGGAATASGSASTAASGSASASGSAPASAPGSASGSGGAGGTSGTGGQRAATGIPQYGTAEAQPVRSGGGKKKKKHSKGGGALTEQEVEVLGGKSGSGKKDTNKAIQPCLSRFHSGAPYTLQLENLLGRRGIAFDDLFICVDAPVVLHVLFAGDRGHLAREALAPLFFGLPETMAIPTDEQQVEPWARGCLRKLAELMVEELHRLLPRTAGSVARKDSVCIVFEASSGKNMRKQARTPADGNNQAPPPLLPVVAPWVEDAEGWEIVAACSDVDGGDVGTDGGAQGIYSLHKQPFEADRRGATSSSGSNKAIRLFLNVGGTPGPDGLLRAFNLGGGLAVKKAGHVAKTLRLGVAHLSLLAQQVGSLLPDGALLGGPCRVVFGVDEADPHIIRRCSAAMAAPGADKRLCMPLTSDRDLLYMSGSNDVHGIIDLFTDNKGVYLKRDVLKELDAWPEELKTSVLVAGSHNTIGNFIGADKVRRLLREGRKAIEDALEGGTTDYIRAALDLLASHRESSPKTKTSIRAQRDAIVKVYYETEGKDPDGRPLRMLEIPLDRPPSGKALFPDGKPLAEGFATAGLSPKQRELLTTEQRELEAKVAALKRALGEVQTNSALKKLNNELALMRRKLAENLVRPGLRDRYMVLKAAIKQPAQLVPAPEVQAAAAANAGLPFLPLQRPAAPYVNLELGPELAKMMDLIVKAVKGKQKRYRTNAAARKEREETVADQAKNSVMIVYDEEGIPTMHGRVKVDVLVAAPATGGGATAAAGAAPTPMDVDSGAGAAGSVAAGGGGPAAPDGGAQLSAAPDVEMQDAPAGAPAGTADDDDEPPEDEEVVRRRREEKGKSKPAATTAEPADAAMDPVESMPLDVGDESEDDGSEYVDEEGAGEADESEESDAGSKGGRRKGRKGDGDSGKKKSTWLGKATIAGPILENMARPGFVEAMRFASRELQKKGEAPDRSAIQHFLEVNDFIPYTWVPTARRAAQLKELQFADRDFRERGKLAAFLRLALTTDERLMMLCYAVTRIAMDAFLSNSEEVRTASFPHPWPKRVRATAKEVQDAAFSATVTAVRLSGRETLRGDQEGSAIANFLDDLRGELLELGLEEFADPVAIHAAFERRATDSADKEAVIKKFPRLCRVYSHIAKDELGLEFRKNTTSDKEIADKDKSLFLHRTILRLAPFASWAPRAPVEEGSALGIPEELDLAAFFRPAPPVDEGNAVGDPQPPPAAAPTSAELKFTAEPLTPARRQEYLDATRNGHLAQAMLGVLSAMEAAAGLGGNEFMSRVEAVYRTTTIGGLEPRHGNPADANGRWVYGDLSEIVDPRLPTTEICANCPKGDVVLGSRRYFLNETNRILFTALDTTALDRLRGLLAETKDEATRTAIGNDIAVIEFELQKLHARDTQPADFDDAHWPKAIRARARVMGNLVFTDASKVCPLLFIDGDGDCCCCDSMSKMMGGGDWDADVARRALLLHRRIQLEHLRLEFAAFRPTLVIGLGSNMARMLCSTSGSPHLPKRALPFATGGILNVEVGVGGSDLATAFQLAVAPHPVACALLPSHLADSVTALCLLPNPAKADAGAVFDPSSYSAAAALNAASQLAAHTIFPQVFAFWPERGTEGVTHLESLPAAHQPIPESFIPSWLISTCANIFTSRFKEKFKDRFQAYLEIFAANGLGDLAFGKSRSHLDSATRARIGQGAPAPPAGLLGALAYRARCLLVPRSGQAASAAVAEDGDEVAVLLEDDGQDAVALTPRESVSAIYGLKPQVADIVKDLDGLGRHFLDRSSERTRPSTQSLLDAARDLLFGAAAGAARLRPIADIRRDVGLGEVALTDLKLDDKLGFVRSAVVAGDLNQRLTPRLHAGDRLSSLDKAVFGKWLTAYIGFLLRQGEGGKDEFGAPVSFGLADSLDHCRIPGAARRGVLAKVKECLRDQDPGVNLIGGDVSTLLRNYALPGAAALGAGSPRDRLHRESSNYIASNGVATRVLFEHPHHTKGFNRLGGARSAAKPGQGDLPQDAKWVTGCVGCPRGRGCDRQYPSCSACTKVNRQCFYEMPVCECCDKARRVCDGRMPSCGQCTYAGDTCSWDLLTAQGRRKAGDAEDFAWISHAHHRTIPELAGWHVPGAGASSTHAFMRGVVLEGELCTSSDPGPRNGIYFQKMKQGDKDVVYYFDHKPSVETATDVACNIVAASVDPGEKGDTISVTAFVQGKDGKLEELTLDRLFRPLSSKGYRAKDEAARPDEWWTEHQDLSTLMAEVSKSPYPVDGMLAASAFLNHAGPLLDHAQSHHSQLAKEYRFREKQARQAAMKNWILAAGEAVWRQKVYLEAFNAHVEKERPKLGEPPPDRDHARKIEEGAHAAGRDAVAAIERIPNPIVLCGAGQGSGSRMPYVGSIAEFLSRHFLVFLLGEYFTSQLCPTCLAKLEPNPLQRGDVVHKRCATCKRNPDRDGFDGELVLNKNRSATLCLVRIFLHIVATGDRPAVFTHRAASRNAG